MDLCLIRVTGLYVMLLMRANSFLGQVGGCWALKILTFLGPKWHSPIFYLPWNIVYAFQLWSQQAFLLRPFTSQLRLVTSF
jgi:hypothetical protein